MKKYTQDEFIKKSMFIHKNLSYEYHKVLYLNNDSQVIIVCKEHGDFYMTPKNHLKGQKCKSCAYKYRNNRNSNTIEFIKKAERIYGKDKYDYSKIEYKNARSKINIICKVHGQFSINPSNHINAKQGCKDCGLELIGFNRSRWIKKCENKICIFYILKCWSDKEYFYKFGITSNSVKKRFGGKSVIPYQYEVIKQIKSSDAGYIWDLEKRFKRFKIKNKYIPLIKFSGTTECFK